MTFRFPLRRPLSHYGFTVLELAIVLTIVGLIISGIWFYGAQALYNVKVEKLEAQIVHIITRSHEVFSNTLPVVGGVVSGNVTQGAITANIFPSESLVADAAQPSGYDADEPFSLANGTAAAFSLSYTIVNNVAQFTLNMPYVTDATCTSVLTYLSNSATVQQLGLVSYGSVSAVGNARSPFNAGSTVAALAAFCGNAPGGHTLYIVFNT